MVKILEQRVQSQARLSYAESLRNPAKRNLKSQTSNLKLLDSLSPSQRHNNMAAIHSKNTKPELIVRRYLFANGFRFRLNDPRLPGHPDIVMRKYATCIFVNGCFWHGHDGCPAYRIPKTNTEFWQNKISRNKARDSRTIQQLTALGWNCITVWECQLKPALREDTLASLQQTLLQIYLHKTQPKLPAAPYNLDEELPLRQAAEPQTPN